MELVSNIKDLRSEQDTITRSDLLRLAFCNSKRLPFAVNDDGVRRRWVGIGWIDDGEPRGDEVLVVDDPRKVGSNSG